MFNAEQYRLMYDKFMGPLAQPVTLMINNGTGYTSYPNVMAHVSAYKDNDLIAGGSIQLGDLRLIILNESIPSAVVKMEMKDRIDIGGRTYAPINWDNHTRSVGDEVIAVEVAVRG